MAKSWRTEQDFYLKRGQLFVERQLFEDTEFPCPAQEEGSPCMWVRPPTLINSPVFLRDATKPGAVQQGQMSCNSFPVVLDILQRRPYLWNYVVSQDQHFDQEYAGMFLFRFWRSGKIEPVIVDDFLPFDVDSRTFMLSTVSNSPDMWCVLMEKAYAKFLGGYESLKAVSLSDVITDVLGCTVQLYKLEKMGAKLYKILKSVFDFGNIPLAKVHVSAAATEVLCPKLIHSLFAVTSVMPEKDETGELQWIVNLWQPWINPGNLDTSSCDLLSSYSFTMKEFTKIFAELYVGVPRFPHLMSGPSGEKSWQTQMISSKWAHSVKADSEIDQTFVRVLLSKPDSYGEKRSSTVIISLMQCCTAPIKLEMGLVIYGLVGNEKLQKTLSAHKLALSQPLVKTELYAKKEISLFLSVEPGEYLIVPELKDGCNRRGHTRYLLTLYSVEPITLMIGPPQKYGEEFLSQVSITISACQHVVIGQPIRVTAKITDFPKMTRYTMTVMLMFRRTSSSDPRETTIKVRKEYLEVCQGLMDKELALWVYYNEYIRFPLKSEEFVVRCTAFIHELSTEISAHTVITTVLPKIKMAVDKNVVALNPTMVTAMLHNTLPISISSARFRVHCSVGNEGLWLTGSSYEIPPFATIWIMCRLKSVHPRCHEVKVYFLSEAFNRSVSLQVQVTDNEGFMLDKCPSIQHLQGGRISPSSFGHGDVHMISCCIKHSQVKLDIFNTQVMSSWYSIDEEKSKPTEIIEESPEEMFYCASNMMRDVTPECEFPEDLNQEDTNSLI